MNYGRDLLLLETSADNTTLHERRPTTTIVDGRVLKIFRRVGYTSFPILNLRHKLCFFVHNYEQNRLRERQLQVRTIRKGKK
jgi:hypothetical protein